MGSFERVANIAGIGSLIAGGLVFAQTITKFTANIGLIIVACLLGSAALVGKEINRIAGLAGVTLGLTSLVLSKIHPLLLHSMSDLFQDGLFEVKDLVFLERIIFLSAAAIGVWGLYWLTKRPTLTTGILKEHPLDLSVTRDSPVVIKHMDRYLHTLVVGTIGTGKSSRVLKPMIEQDLKAIKAGHKIGVTVIEPKGDLAEDVANMAKAMGVPVIFINPDDPATPKFNPLAIGDADTAAEIARTVFKNLFGRQDPFFSNNQQQAIRSTVQLLRKLKGRNVTLEDAQFVLRNFEHLKVLVQTLEEREGTSSLVEYFRRDVLAPQMQDKVYQWLLGLRLQLDNILGNPLIKNVLVGQSDIDLDDHLAEGGRVLVVNTAMHLGTLGDFFGQFVIMHLENAVFRRPGTEWTRIPHALYIDEFPRYANADFERLLAIGRSFRCATTIAVQNTGQIVLEENKQFRDITLGLCRNKIILNTDNADDAKRFAAEMGQVEVIEKHLSYKRHWTVFFPWREEGLREEKRRKERFDYTQIMEIPKFHAIVRVTQNGQAQPPVMIPLKLSEYDTRKKQKPKVKKHTGKLVIKDLPEMGPKLDIKIPKAEEEESWF
ncbi:MAG: type IV secretion system DNA-binding domain-containing protein [Candidatus Methanomethyliaceae archaeon]